MNVPQSSLSIVMASQTDDCLQAALAYHKLDLSVLPLKGKRPALDTWAEYQTRRASELEIRRWAKDGLLQNVGIVCGEVSNNLVVIDFDGLGGYGAFAALFPELAQSCTVRTGSGQGMHLYLYVDRLPSTVKAMDTPVGNIELRAAGSQVVAPPSIHPVTGNAYTVEKELAIRRVGDLDAVVNWIEGFKADRPEKSAWQPPRHMPSIESSINPAVINAIADRLRQRRHHERGDWLNCSCIYPERHTNGDRHPSFGLNLQSGYSFCYRCGTILAKNVCEVLGIDPQQYGGLVMQTPSPVVVQSESDRGIPTPPAELTPPPQALPPIGEIPLPDWLHEYTGWASRIGNQTPVIFHQAAGIWQLAVAIARRLYVTAPWGVKIWPNLYMMFVADTTFYRKTTAFKLAGTVIRETIPHMLMPTPGSPERFQEALSGKLPGNYKELTYAQQELLSKARGFAAQRGLFKDEVAGLFGAFNRKDYMYGMKDLVMELYDCPDYSDKDTQAGLTIVENAALSILGVTTPAGLSAATSQADWSNGLMPRFLLLTPELDYEERPTLKKYEPPPDLVVSGLKQLHERLPMPVQEGDTWQAPDALEVDAHCWDEVQAYSSRLRANCDPHRETPLDDRLKGVYGRLHVQAVKLAMILSALDWMKTGDEKPTITPDNWQQAELLTEHWRASAHRLLEQLDRNGAGRDERHQQDRVYQTIREAGAGGIGLRDVYRRLNMKAQDARNMTQELIKAGLIAPVQIGSAEGYLAVEHLEN
ncbi:MAG: bifunctional DNA primase/polymerase [Anaerolineae bacterium]|nr:bifunctional DNA primase/polymerase [Anaerolineae bacterium]